MSHQGATRIVKPPPHHSTQFRRKTALYQTLLLRYASGEVRCGPVLRRASRGASVSHHSGRWRVRPESTVKRDGLSLQFKHSNKVNNADWHAHREAVPQSLSPIPAPTCITYLSLAPLLCIRLYDLQKLIWLSLLLLATSHTSVQTTGRRIFIMNHSPPFQSDYTSL